MRFPSLTGPGASLIEVVLAIGLFSIFASTLFVFMGSQLLRTVGSNQTLEALPLAREGLEAARVLRDSSWTLLATGTHGLVYTSSTWAFQGSSDTINGFTRSITVSELSSSERQVVSTISWINASQQPRSLSVATNLSNWRYATTTPPVLEGDWGDPQEFGTVDLGAGIQPTGLAVRNGMVYMVSTAAAANKSDFFVVNAQDPYNPVVEAELNIGPGTMDVAVLGDFAYLANYDTSNQLTVINISVTSSPQNVRNKFIPSFEEGLSVAVSGTYLFIGMERDSGKAEIFPVDIYFPAAPETQHGAEMDGNVNQLRILGDRLFAATSNTSSELGVLDISNPTAITNTAYVDLPGTNAAIGLDISANGTRLTVTRAAAAGTSPEINVFDITNPDAPVLINSAEFSDDIPAALHLDDLLFLGTAMSNLEFQIFTTPLLVYSAGLNFPQVITDMAFENNLLYIALRSNDALRIISAN